MSLTESYNFACRNNANPLIIQLGDFGLLFDPLFDGSEVVEGRAGPVGRLAWEGHVADLGLVAGLVLEAVEPVFAGDPLQLGQVRGLLGKEKK